MKPKEKAQDLWVKYYERLPDSIYSNYAAKMEAKYFALIAVNELLDTLYHYEVSNGYTDDWEKVKKEIEAL